jgi:hypothetical protein
VRVALHQIAVFESARLGFVSIADDVLGFRRILRHEAPLHACGKASAATPAQTRFFDFVDNVVRRHRVERLLERFVAAVLAIDIKALRIFQPETREQQRFTTDCFNTHKFYEASLKVRRQQSDKACSFSLRASIS